MYNILIIRCYSKERWIKGEKKSLTIKDINTFTHNKIFMKSELAEEKKYIYKSEKQNQIATYILSLSYIRQYFYLLYRHKEH